MYYFWLLYLGIRKDNVTFFCSKKHLRKHCTPQVRKYFTPKPKTQNPKPTHTHTHTMHHSASLHGNRRPRVKKALGHPLRIATRGTQGARRPIPVALFFLASISSARSSFAFRQNLRKFWVFPFPIRLYRVLLTDFLHSVKIWVHLSAERRLGFGAFWLLFDASEAAGGIRQQVRRNAVKKKKKRYVFSLSCS